MPFLKKVNLLIFKFSIDITKIFGIIYRVHQIFFNLREVIIMFLLDFTDPVWELLVKGYDFLYNHNDSFRSFSNDIEGLFIVYSEKIATFVLDHVSWEIFRQLEFSLKLFRKMTTLRYLMTWLPFFNPYGTIFELLVVPVDFILRPLTWNIPKYALFELTGWFSFVIIDTLITICSFMQRFSELYEIRQTFN